MQSISALIALLVCSLFALAQVNTPPRNWHTATLPDLKAAAESGAPDAQFEYGSRFETGRGVTKDQEEANSWYRKASQQGNVSAQFALASRLIEGTAAEQKEACNLFEKAAQTGNAQAAREAGLCYKLGQGSIQDAAKAFTYFTQAATGGDTEGAYQLGMCYRKGEGVAANPAQATRYLNQAANAGHADALTQLAEMTRSGEGAAKNPREALNLYLRAANKGSVTAQWELARMYRDGDGVPPDPAKALLWTKKLASAKQPEAQATLAQLNIDLFKQSARPLTIRGGEITDSQIGALVKLDGEVRSTAEGKWKISIKVLGGQNHVVQVIPPAYVPGAKKTDQPARRPDSSRQNTRDDNT
ncbi:MAG TPA: tetratricopeptide repeat protein, partial [Tepidisphaeraceae bacterium]